MLLNLMNFLWRISCESTDFHGFEGLCCCFPFRFPLLVFRWVNFPILGTSLGGQLQDAGHWSGGRIWLFKQSHDFSMALIERNRWFTELKFSMVDLSMANCECHNQMDIRKWRELWISQRSASPHRRRWSVVRCVSNFLGWLSRIWNGQWLWTTGDQRVGWSLFREA